ncbi:phage tail protein [Phreatobacter stygius]|uniref:Phage tail protein n=1 Tax=Phreatobacter stygius TaxID=1940610 RepID=A0A4D7AYY7_9HYPH|nr:phage tail protein [Phreatobacter stygius]QCI65521.1 phage tail protein [Phreatobacter stygius]
MSLVMIIGPVAFGLRAFSPHAREVNAKWRWHEVERIGAYPGLQFLGKGAKSMALVGTLMPGAVTGHSAATPYALEAFGDLGQPLPVALGNGDYWGLWVIDSLKDAGLYLGLGGVARKSDITLTLKYFGG